MFKNNKRKLDFRNYMYTLSPCFYYPLEETVGDAVNTAPAKTGVTAYTAGTWGSETVRGVAHGMPGKFGFQSPAEETGITESIKHAVYVNENTERSVGLATAFTVTWWQRPDAWVTHNSTANGGVASLFWSGKVAICTMYTGSTYRLRTASTTKNYASGDDIPANWVTAYPGTWHQLPTTLTGKWVHFALTFNYVSNGSIRLYINGHSCDTYFDGSSSIWRSCYTGSGTAKHWIGCWNSNGGASATTASLSDFAFYNYILTPAQLKLAFTLSGATDWTGWTH